MRLLPLALVLTACDRGTLVDPTGDWTPPDVSEVQARGMEPLAETENRGQGVVPTVDVPGAWLGMGDRICEVRGQDGELSTDVWIGENNPGVGVIDVGPEGFLGTTPIGVGLVTGDVTVDIPVAGAIGGGALVGDHALIATLNDGVCELAWAALDGTGTTRHPVGAAHCGPGVDLEGGALGAFVGGGAEVLRVTDASGPVPFAAGSLVALDDVAGLVFVADPGDGSIRALDADGVPRFDVSLPAGLVDFAASGGTLVALLDTDELIRFDSHKGTFVDQAPYYGVLGVDRIEISGTGRALVAVSPMMVQFYALHPTP